MRHYRYLQYSAKKDPIAVVTRVYDANGVDVGTINRQGVFMSRNYTRPHLARCMIAQVCNGQVYGSKRQRREMLMAIRWLRLNP